MLFPLGIQYRSLSMIFLAPLPSPPLTQAAAGGRRYNTLAFDDEHEVGIKEASSMLSSETIILTQSESLSK